MKPSSHTKLSTGLRLQSMQMRLLALLCSGVVLVWLAAVGWTWVDARHEVDELLDSHLAQAAALLVMQQAHVDDDDEGSEAPVLHKYAPRVAFQVFHDGVLVMRSGNVGSQAMSSLSRGFATVRLDDGSRWRVFAARGSKRDIQVYVGEQLSARNSILLAVLRSLLLPSVLALPMLALLIWWSVRRALAPLDALGQHLRTRAPQSTEALDVAGLPTEMQPMVQALNALLVRMEHMVQAERRFTADAAHELRTPIAAIRAQAQVALGAADDDAQRLRALHQTVAGCDRAAHLVDQLLTLARLDAPDSASTADSSTPFTRPCTDVAALAHSVAAELAPHALAQGLDLELQTTPGGSGCTGCRVPCDEALLRVLLRNLIDNALRYGPSGTRVLVQVQCDADTVTLTVRDSGPGMTEADMARLGERFFRVLGSSASGSGLGWSIVRRIAAASGAQVQVQRCAQWGGLQVDVRWLQCA